MLRHPFHNTTSNSTALSRLQGLFLWLFLGFFLGACKAPSIQVVPQPKQALAPGNTEEARIYLFRRPQTYGRSRMLRGYENTNLIGRIEAHHYLYWNTNAGRKLISAVYERRPVDGGDIEGVLDLLCKPGQSYYIAVELASTKMGRPQLALIESAEAHGLLADLTPAIPQQ